METLDANGDVAGTVGEYSYDGDGRRVRKHVPSTGETTVFVYDAGGKQIAEYSTTVAPQTQAKVAYLTSDHLGSPRINTDQSGAVISRHDHHPFGEEISTTQRSNHPEYAGDRVRKQFTGYEQDEEAELDFAQARYYAKGLGRFNSVDPENFGASIFEPQGWNGYAYVINDPINFTDPTGLEFRICNKQGQCWTHDDKQVRQAQRTGEYNFVGSVDGRSGLESGVIKDKEGNEIGTYQQTSFDNPIQRMAWGGDPTMRVWKPVIDHVGTAVITEFALPPGSGQIINYAGRAISAAEKAAEAARIAKAAELALNGAKGNIGEALARNALAARGHIIRGQRVSIKVGNLGRRVMDYLVESPTGELIKVEVKTGAGRGANQLAKDALLESGGGTFVGGNAARAGISPGTVIDSIRTMVINIP